jgi:transcriptional regulator GlxA family with amidase domain
VEEDLGAEVARDVARVLVVFLRRTGNQAQFSAQLQTQVADRRPVRELQQYIADHPDADLSLAALARRLHMSPRHFGRVFCQQVGMPPGRYVERIRLETARRRLEESDHVETVALAAGFGSAETMRRVFVSNLAVSPTDYRHRFGRSQKADPA